MAKGASKTASTNSGIGQSYSEGYQGGASGISSTELPFLQNELTNPQGFGQPAVNQMETQGGQAVAGAAGAGTEAADLLASRTGNTAAVPGVIDNSTRNAMKQQSNNVLSVDQANNQAKLQQQQEGSEGLEKMYGTDVTAALNALGLSNQAVSDWTQADNPNNSFGEQYILNGEKAAANAASQG